MEEESKNDLIRIGGITSFLFGIIFLGMVTFSGSNNSLTGAVVAESGSSLTGSGIIYFALGFILLIVGAIALFKLNR